jgi:hypothetical protein
MRKAKSNSPPIFYWRRLPYRLTTEQLAARCNCDTDAVRSIVDAKLVAPLADPPKGAPMYFATAEVEELANDIRWLAKMTKVIREKVKAKNAKRKNGGQS